MMGLRGQSSIQASRRRLLSLSRRRCERRHESLDPIPTPCSAATAVRCNSTAKKAWPSVHPQKKRLRRIQNVLSGKDPDAGVGPVPEPTRRELYVVGMHQAIPFVGFGIMDNAILLLAGEAIDIYLGVTLGISTMCAAAIGNIVSDICGVAFGTVVEDTLIGGAKKIESITGGRVRIPPMPKLTYEQRNLRSVRWSGQLGCAAGLTIGCIIGMFPLLFFPDVDREGASTNNGGEGELSASKKIVADQSNARLEKEIEQWKEKHDDVLKRLTVLEREKNDRIWESGY